jgi:hypothetical protein
MENFNLFRSGQLGAIAPGNCPADRSLLENTPKMLILKLRSSISKAVLTAVFIVFRKKDPKDHRLYQSVAEF